MRSNSKKPGEAWSEIPPTQTEIKKDTSIIFVVGWVFAGVFLSMAFVSAYAGMLVLAILFAILAGFLLTAPLWALWLMVFLFIACGSPVPPLGPIEPIVPEALSWCVFAVSKKGILMRLCTEYESTCQWVEGNARQYGHLAGLSQVGKCSTR